MNGVDRRGLYWLTFSWWGCYNLGYLVCPICRWVCVLGLCSSFILAVSILGPVLIKYYARPFIHREKRTRSVPPHPFPLSNTNYIYQQYCPSLCILFLCLFLSATVVTQLQQFPAVAYCGHMLRTQSCQNFSL